MIAVVVFHERSTNGWLAVLRSAALPVEPPSTYKAYSSHVGGFIQIAAEYLDDSENVEEATLKERVDALYVLHQLGYRDVRMTDAQGFLLFLAQPNKEK